MTREATTRFEQLLAVVLVALLLRRQLAVKSVLPEISRNRFQIFRAFFAIDFETPEGRHLRAGPERLWVLQPLDDPFGPQLQANIFQIWTDFFLILLEITRLQVEFINSGGQLTVLHAQRLGMRQEALH